MDTHDPHTPSPRNSRKPSLADVAVLAQVSKMTVSRMLRFPHMVSPKTKERIQSALDQLGYTPDPFISIYTTRLKTSRSSHSNACIGLVHTFHQDIDSLKSFFYTHLLRGSRETAHNLGYELISITMKELKENPSASTRILRSRGILGLIISPMDSPKATLLNIDWTPFAAVSLGYSLSSPRLHRVCTDHTRSMLLAIERLRKKGYRRIGCCLLKKTDLRMNHLWHGAFHTQTMHFPSSQQIPCFVGNKSQTNLFLDWIHRWKPDALIGSSTFFYHLLLKAGYKVPEMLEFIALAIHEAPHVPVPGLMAQPDALGTAAVELLVSQFHHAQYGIPAHPKTLLVETTWRNRPPLDSQS